MSVPHTPAGGLKRAAFVGVLWSLLQAWGVRIITLLHFVVIARLLEPADLGVIAFAAAIVACLATLVDQGMTTIVEATAQHDPKMLDTAWWATVVASLLVCAGIYLTAPALARWTEKDYLYALLPVLGTTVVFAAVSAVQLALLKARFLNRSIAVAYLVGNVVGAATGIGCALAGLAYWSLVIKALVEGALISALLFWWSPWRPGRHFDVRLWLSLLHKSLPVIGMRVLDIANQRLDALLVGARLGATALGFYATGQRIYQIAMEALFSAVNQVSLPVFGRVSAQPGRSGEILLRMVACTSLLTFPAFALVAVTGVDLVTVVFGAKWRAAGPVLSVFALGGILFSVSYFNAPLLVAGGHARQVFWLTLLNAVGNVIGFLVAVPFGATAVAAAFVVRGYLVYPVNLWLLRRATGMTYRAYAHSLWPALAASVLAAAGSGAVVLAPQTAAWSPVARLAGAWAIGVTVYALTIGIVFRASTFRVLNEVRDMVQAARAPATLTKLET